MIVLTLNGGSSSLKFGLYRVDGASPQSLMTGEADADGIIARDAQGEPLPLRSMPAGTTPDCVIPVIARLLIDEGLPPPEAVGHRIVHGGPNLRAHCRIDASVLRELDHVQGLSPLHAPLALAIIALAQTTWPDIPQIACFDTVFHANMPEVARTLPLPRELRDQGIQRYGFHGLSCESIVQQLGPNLPRRTIIAHLGNGASVTALLDGHSIDTSMGLTPSGGVVMGTRSGDLDPGILIHLLREKGYDPAGIEQLVDHRSGLLGISGLSGDMRALHGAAADDASARLAIDMFCLSVAKAIAAMAVTLQGMDAIIFTGGIGEHDDAVRTRICAQLAWLGVQPEAARNTSGTAPIDHEGARCRIFVLPSREDEQIARHSRALVA
jgi:acetate kinase